MEINKIIQIIEENFRLDSEDYIALMGVAQELQQYREGVEINGELPISIQRDGKKCCKRTCRKKRPE